MTEDTQTPHRTTHDEQAVTRLLEIFDAHQIEKIVEAADGMEYGAIRIEFVKGKPDILERMTTQKMERRTYRPE